MFENFSTSLLKKWITNKKVLFVTNSTLLPGTSYVASLKSYINDIPIHNLYIIPGFGISEKPYTKYGLGAFIDMLCLMYMKNMPNHYYDYVIYIDDDCIITDFRALLEEFAEFIKDDGYCIGGPQDGGVICHRNHSHLMVNTFLSFWNLKVIRNSFNRYDDIVATARKYSVPGVFYKDMTLSDKSQLMYSMIHYADRMVDKIKQYREANFLSDGTVPYAEIVKNDESNKIEQHQIPYSFEDCEKDSNFEPYYCLEKAIVAQSGLPIYYFFATDLYDKKLNDEDTDNSGLTSAVYTIDEPHKLIAVHSWFSRAYTRFPMDSLQKKHTTRINRLLVNYAKL